MPGICGSFLFMDISYLVVPVVLSVQELWPCRSAVNNSVLEGTVMKINDYKV